MRRQIFLPAHRTRGQRLPQAGAAAASVLTPSLSGPVVRHDLALLGLAFGTDGVVRGAVPPAGDWLNGDEGQKTSPRVSGRQK